MKELAERLNLAYRRNSSDNWPWFETRLTYENARIPQALMAAAYLLGDDEMIQNSTKALSWLIHVQTDRSGNFMPIGSDGFYAKGGPRAIYDQQPVEAAATIDACCEAYRCTDDSVWQRETWRAYSWYLGANSERMSLVDPDTGGCRDGLSDRSVNQNQGAEATLGFLSATLAVRQLDMLVNRRGHGFLG